MKVKILLSMVIITILSCDIISITEREDNTVNGISISEPEELTDSQIALKNSIAGLEQPIGLETASAQSITDTATGETETETTEQVLDATGRPVTYKTQVQKYTASASFDTQILLNPSSDVIYPGSILLGHTIDDGSFVEVTSGEKREITLSYDLTGVEDGDGNNGYVSGTIIPSLSNFREFHNTILSQEIPPQSTSYSYEAIEINDESEFDLKINAGANYSDPTIEVSVKAGFDYSSNNTKNKYMVRFMQTFYTIDIDQNSKTFLFDDIDIKELGGYRPVYVSSVAYGRLAYLSIESEESWESIKANLDVVVNTATSGDYTGDFELAMDELSSKTTFNITVIGGSSVVTTIDGFEEFLTEGGFSSENPGKIISYKLRFVDDNSVANTVFNGEYTIREVVATQGEGIKVGIRVKEIQNRFYDNEWFEGGSVELYGTIEYTYDSSMSYLWSYSSSSTYNINDNEDKEYDGTWIYKTVNSNYDQITLEIKDLKDKDNVGHDSFHNTTEIYTISDLNDGDTITLRADDNVSDISNAYVDFILEVDKEILY